MHNLPHINLTIYRKLYKAYCFSNDIVKKCSRILHDTVDNNEHLRIFI